MSEYSSPNQGGTVSPETLRELMSHAMHFLMTSVTPQYEFWAGNGRFKQFNGGDGARFKELDLRNLGMALDFFYHAWFPHIGTQDIILVPSAVKFSDRLQRLLLLLCVSVQSFCAML